MLNFNAKKNKSIQVLVILDGWGVAPVWGGNAISLADVRNFNQAYRKYPATTLLAAEEGVGLPHGSTGNSEVGHLNIGAGHLVRQDQPIIDEQIENGRFFENKVILEAIEHAKKNHSNLHLMGLLSKSGTHSHLDHLYALLRLLSKQNFKNVYIHLFGDGRDSDSMAGIEMINEVEAKTKEYGVGEIVSVVGRFYAMDRDNRWERIRQAYLLLTEGNGKEYPGAMSVFAESYARGTTDEFIEPSIIANKTKTKAVISNNDSIIFFNFRADRSREITLAFLQDKITGFADRKKLENIYFATFAMHDDREIAHTAFMPDKVMNPLAEVWSEAGFRQYHTAETEKYAHVTFYFNGGREKPFPGEDRMMIPSPKNVKTYDLAPEMNAKIVTETLLAAMKKKKSDCFVVNFANPDMVGHTGNLKATVKAVEFVDLCLGKIFDFALKNNGVVYVFADHGNAEQMVNPKTGNPETEHTTNLVPFMIVSDDPKLQALKLRNDGRLASIAPTVLDIMKLSYDKKTKDESLILNKEILT